MIKSEWLEQISFEKANEICMLHAQFVMPEGFKTHRHYTDARERETWSMNPEIWGDDRLWRCHICDHTWPEGRDDCHNCHESERPE